MPASLRATLVAVAGLLAETRDPWWVIGSAAARLHGADGPPPADVDVLVSVADGGRLAGRLRPRAGDADSDLRFRSVLFGGWGGAPLPVEVMAGLTLRASGGWRPVSLATRAATIVDGATLYVPEHGELVALLRRFGRPKDLSRPAALIALAP